MSTDKLSAADALQTYLAHIGFAGEPRADLATLAELSRLHLEAFPYENLDVQLGRRVSRDPEAAFLKLVHGGRGGWCYEFNGLFAWMLEAVGFKVRRLAGAVMREKAGEKMVGNHLVPIVELDGRRYLVDVAMGQFEPAPLVEGPIVQGFRRYSLERLPDGWWRFRNHPGALPPSFDFSLELEDPSIMDCQSEFLQSNPVSPFVRHAIIQRHFADRMESLVGRMHSVIDAAGERVTEIPTRAAYEQVARERFGLELPDSRMLWAKVSVAPEGGFLAGMDQAA